MDIEKINILKTKINQIPQVCTFECLDNLKYLIVSPGNCGTSFVCNYIQACINLELNLELNIF